MREEASRLIADELYRATMQLRRQCRVIRLRALMAVMATVVNLCVAFASIVLTFSPGVVPYTAAYIPVMVAVSLLALIVSLALLVVYDQARRCGDAFFVEISEEVERRERLPRNDADGLPPGKRDSVPRDHLEEHPSDELAPAIELGRLRARIAAREFARTTDLPLVSGSDGPWRYATLNTMVAFMAALFTGISGTLMR